MLGAVLSFVAHASVPSASAIAPGPIARSTSNEIGKRTALVPTAASQPPAIAAETSETKRPEDWKNTKRRSAPTMTITAAAGSHVLLHE